MAVAVAVDSRVRTGDVVRGAVCGVVVLCLVARCRRRHPRRGRRDRRGKQTARARLSAGDDSLLVGRVCKQDNKQNMQRASGEKPPPVTDHPSSSAHHPARQTTLNTNWEGTHLNLPWPRKPPRVKSLSRLDPSLLYPPLLFRIASDMLQ